MEDAETGRSSPGVPAMMTSSSLAPVPAAARRYYDCVFCKRGFTTAQALGGHMNVHRRDRPKPAAPDIDAPTATGCYMAYPWPSAAPPPQPPMRCGGSSFVLAAGLRCTGNNAEVAVWPAAAAAGGPIPRPREQSLFGADNDNDDDGRHGDHDLRLGLGCHGGGLRAPEEEGQDQPERNKLDLELRLGPRPRH